MEDKDCKTQAKGPAFGKAKTHQHSSLKSLSLLWWRLFWFRFDT